MGAFRGAGAGAGVGGNGFVGGVELRERCE